MEPVEVRAEAIGRGLYDQVRSEARASRGADRWASRILHPGPFRDLVRLGLGVARVGKRIGLRVRFRQQHQLETKRGFCGLAPL
jgi:hypothetical protein